MNTVQTENFNLYIFSLFNRQHTMSKLSRAIKFIMGIWLVAFCLAIPQAIQFGVVIVEKRGPSCTVSISLFLFLLLLSSFFIQN